MVSVNKYWWLPCDLLVVQKIDFQFGLVFDSQLFHKTLDDENF